MDYKKEGGFINTLQDLCTMENRKRTYSMEEELSRILMDIFLMENGK